MFGYVFPAFTPVSVVFVHMHNIRVYTLVHVLSPAFLSEVELLRDWLTAIRFDCGTAFREGKRCRSSRSREITENSRMEFHAGIPSYLHIKG